VTGPTENSDFVSRQPELTVSMPAYNTAPYIRAAVDSALMQEGVDFELIVVDDASEDETNGLMKRLLSIGASCSKVQYGFNGG